LKCQTIKLGFCNNVPSAVCGHGAASNALSGKMFARGSVASRSNRAPSQRQKFLRCTTASYHADDFRKEKTKMEDE